MSENLMFLMEGFVISIFYEVTYLLQLLSIYLIYKFGRLNVMCSSRKYLPSLHGRFLFYPPPPPRNSSLALYFASKILAFKTPPPRNFGWASMGWVWIFSGTTQFSVKYNIAEEDIKQC